MRPEELTKDFVGGEFIGSQNYGVAKALFVGNEIWLVRNGWAGSYRPSAVPGDDWVRLVPEGSGVELGEPAKEDSLELGERVIVRYNDDWWGGIKTDEGVDWQYWDGRELFLCNSQMLANDSQYYRDPRPMPSLPAPKEKSLEEKIEAAIADAEAGKFYGETLYNVPKAVRNILALLKAEKERAEQ